MYGTNSDAVTSNATVSLLLTFNRFTGYRGSQTPRFRALSYIQSVFNSQMMKTFTLPLSFRSRPALGRYVFRQISPNFSNLEKMSEGWNITESVCEDADSSAPQFCDDNEGWIWVGSMKVPLEKPRPGKYTLVGSMNVSIPPYGTNVLGSSSLPLLNTSRTFTASRSMSNSDHLEQTIVDDYIMPSFSSSSESKSLSPVERSPVSSVIGHHDKSSSPHHSWKKSRVAYAEQLYSPHRNLNNALASHKVDTPMRVKLASQTCTKPFDICWPRRLISGLDVTVHANKESCPEKEEGVTEKRILKPGMVLLKHFISHDSQVELVRICRELGLGPGGLYQPGYEGGAKLRLHMMCLGLDWDPQTRKYGNKRSIDGCEPPNIPQEFRVLANLAIDEAQNLIKKKFRVSNAEDVLPSMSPDICIVNFYTAYGRLGLHQDRDESRESLRRGLPVVSFSVGDSAEFLYGNHRDVEKAEKVVLESGDVLIFGGESRLAFHGVSHIIPNSAPKVLLEATGLRRGRLNLTFRQY